MAAFYWAVMDVLARGSTVSVIWVRIDGIVPAEVPGVIAEKAAVAAQAFAVTKPWPGPPYVFEMAAEGERGLVALRMNGLRASLRGLRVGGAPCPTVSVGIVDSRAERLRRHDPIRTCGPSVVRSLSLALGFGGVGGGSSSTTFSFVVHSRSGPRPPDAFSQP